jgi:RNA polymerase sigma-70 factor, ECF subfamily
LLTEVARFRSLEEDLSDGKSGPDAEVRNEVLNLYRSCAKGLLRYILCIVKDLDFAEEVVQEAFLRYYECRLEKAPAPMSPGWVYRVARNYAIDRIRAEHNESYVGLGDAAWIPDHRSSLEAEFERLEAIRQISALLAPRELECVELRFEGFKYKEIAEILGIESGTVGAILARALKKIQSLGVRNGNGHQSEVN